MTQETLPPPQPQAHRRKTGVRIAFGIVLFFLLCIPAAILMTILFVFAVRVDSSTGTVERVTWQRTILITEQGPNGWTVVDKAVGYGNDLNPRWPVLNLKPGQREGERSEQYLVQLRVAAGIHDYFARDAAEFTRFKIGSKWRLTFDAAHKITGVQPAQ
jgi:hypothetical protein